MLTTHNGKCRPLSKAILGERAILQHSAHGDNDTHGPPPHRMQHAQLPNMPQEEAPSTPQAPQYYVESDDELFARYTADCPPLVKFEGFPHHHYIEVVAVHNGKVQLTFWPTTATAPSKTGMTTSMFEIPHNQQPHSTPTSFPSKSTTNTMRHYNQKSRNYSAALNRIQKRQQEKERNAPPPPPSFNAPLKQCCQPQVQPHAQRPVYTQTTVYYYRDDPRCPPPVFQ